MQIIEDFKKYRDQYGLNQIESKDGVGVTTQNGTLFTAQYIICLYNALKEKSMHEDATPLIEEIERVKRVFVSCEVEPGMSIRYPNDKEFDSMDNNSALLVFSAMFDGGRYARDMRYIGLNVNCVGYDTTQLAEQNKKFYPLAKILGCGSPKNYWNNNTENLFCFFGWYGRSPGFMGLIDICATGKTTPFRHLALLVGQFLGCNDDPQNTDARTMSYIIWQLLKNKSIVHKFLYKVWLNILLKYYPNGMKDVYEIYYNRFGTNPNHPLVKYTDKY